MVVASSLASCLAAMLSLPHQSCLCRLIAIVAAPWRREECRDKTIIMGEEASEQGNGSLCKFAKWAGAIPSFYPFSIIILVIISDSQDFSMERHRIKLRGQYEKFFQTLTLMGKHEEKINK